MKALEDWASEGIAALELARAWVRYGIAIGLDYIGRIFMLAAVPAALGCFWLALHTVNPDGFRHLALRYTDALGDTGMLHLVNAALWPVHYAYLIALSAAGRHALRPEALIYAGAGAALLVVVNVVHLKRQTFANPAGKAAVMLWYAAMALTCGDFLRCVLLPVAWDSAPFIGEVSNGAALRAAEIVVTVYLWSLYLVTARSRVNIGVTRTWAQVSMKVRRDIIIQGAILMAAGPFAAVLVVWIMGDTAKADIVRVVMAILVAAYAGLWLLMPLFDTLKLLVSYRISMMSDGDLLVPRQAPPGRPVRW